MCHQGAQRSQRSGKDTAQGFGHNVIQKLGYLMRPKQRNLKKGSSQITQAMQGLRV